MTSQADVVREGEIRRLARRMKHADRMRDADERRRLWERMRELVLARSPEQVREMERAGGLA
jgi:hypothetical protein